MPPDRDPPPSNPRPHPDRVTILLCTRNGARHLQAQLDSYLAQDHPDWDLWVSDDGSTDGTREILQRFAQTQTQTRTHAPRTLRLLDGPGRGGTANFLSLLCHPDLPPGPVALSDQDDVWMPHKLRRGLDALRNGGAVTLYGGQSLHTDTALRVTGRSRPPRRAPCFANALTQNVVSGHSAMLSAAALDLVRRAGQPQGIPYHDWWLYQLVSGAGGDVVIDEAPVLYYRQHAANAMGAHQGLRAGVRRLGQVLDREYGAWIAANVAALTRVEALLTPANRHRLAALRALPRGPGPARAAGLYRLGLHRQGRGATLGLYLAAALGRV